jgi:hypothetical protein
MVVLSRVSVIVSKSSGSGAVVGGGCGVDGGRVRENSFEYLCVLWLCWLCVLTSLVDSAASHFSASRCAAHLSYMLPLHCTVSWPGARHSFGPISIGSQSASFQGFRRPSQQTSAQQNLKSTPARAQRAVGPSCCLGSFVWFLVVPTVPALLGIYCSWCLLRNEIFERVLTCFVFFVQSLLWTMSDAMKKVRLNDLFLRDFQ